MRALSIRQPWAFAVVVGAKTVENRTWSSRHVGRLAIHASKREELGAVRQVLRAIRGQFRLRLGIEGLCQLYKERKALGCVVGQVEMVGCTNGADALATDAEMDRWFEGPAGFVFRNARIAMDPVPCRGRLGMWELPPGVTVRDPIEGRRLIDQFADRRLQPSRH